MTASEAEEKQAAYFAAQMLNLAKRAAKSGIVLYSDFLTVPQQQTAAVAAKRGGADAAFYGGAQDSRRKVAAFSPMGVDIRPADYPITVLRVQFDTRFLKEMPTHRDFLGALMGLSLKRETIGDIIVSENVGYLFVLEKVADYIEENLTAVQRASVSVSRAESCPLSAKALFEELTITAASMRADCIVSQLMRKGRNAASEAILLKGVKADDRVVSKPDMPVKEGQELSIRGYGKYRIQGASPTRKGRIALTVLKYR